MANPYFCFLKIEHWKSGAPSLTDTLTLSNKGSGADYLSPLRFFTFRCPWNFFKLHTKKALTVFLKSERKFIFGLAYDFFYFGLAGQDMSGARCNVCSQLRRAWEFINQYWYLILLCRTRLVWANLKGAKSFLKSPNPFFKVASAYWSWNDCKENWGLICQQDQVTPTVTAWQLLDALGFRKMK